MISSGVAVRLPLWRNCLEKMIQEGLYYGKPYSKEWFEEELKCPFNGMEFSFAITQIRQELEEKGFYLSGRGQKGTGFVIVPAAANADVMKSYQKAAAQALQRALVLGSNTDTTQLTDMEKRKHEAVLERVAIKTALLQRASEFGKLLKGTKAGLLT